MGGVSAKRVLPGTEDMSCFANLCKEATMSFFIMYYRDVTDDYD